MKLSVHLVHQGRYVKAGDPLPADFDLPPHLESFAIYDDEPPQVSQGAARLSSVGRQGVGAGGRLAKPAAIPKARRIRARKEGRKWERKKGRRKEKDYAIIVQSDHQPRPGDAEHVLHGWNLKFRTNSFPLTLGNTGFQEREGRELERELLEWQAIVAAKARTRSGSSRPGNMGRRVSAKIRPIISYCPIGLGKLGKRIVETEAICSR